MQKEQYVPTGKGLIALSPLMVFLIDICGRFLHGAVVGGFCFVVCMGRRHNRPVAVVGTVEGVFQRRGQQ